jgi:hypothetical protein
MLAFRGDARQGVKAVEEHPFSVVVVTFFGKREVARYPTLEQAEWKARELNAWAERNPRGYVQYLVRPVEESQEDE